MKRWILPAALTVALATACVAATFVPAAVLPQDPIRESVTRVSVVCPSFESATADIQVAAVSTDQTVRIAKLSTPQKATETAGLAVVANPGQPLRVSVQRSDHFGATVTSSATDGPARGLAAASCFAPQSEHWFTGVDVSESAQSDLVLVNLDATDAVVDVAAYGAIGRLPAPRAQTVEGNSVSSISLRGITRRDEPITMRVTTSQGRVAAFVRQVTWKGRQALSAEWVPAGIGAQTDQVIPGVAAGAGARRLVVTNPSDRTADVKLDVLGSAGLAQLTEAQNIEVPPLATRAIDLSAGLAGSPAGLRLTSNVEVVAGLVSDNGQPDPALDAAISGAAAPLPDDAVWPLALGKATTANLQLVNASATATTATVEIKTGFKGAPKTSEVKIAAWSTVQVPLPKANVTTVRVRTDSTTLRGAVVATATLGRVKGLAVLDLVADETRVHQATVVFDPHLS